MGVFSNFKNDYQITQRMDDAPGHYLQQIMEVKEVQSQDGRPYLKIFKKIIAVRDNAEGRAHKPGEVVTHALFPSKYNFLERDTRLLLKAGLGLTTEEANELNGKQIEQLLLSQNEGVLDGRVLDVSVRELPNKNKPGSTFTVVSYRNEVDQDDVRRIIGDEAFAEFFEPATA